MITKRRNRYLSFHYLGLCLILVLITLMACGPAQKSMPKESISEIDTTLGEMADAKRFSGSILIAQDDQVLLSKGYGQADIESGEPNSPRHAFLSARSRKGLLQRPS